MGLSHSGFVNKISNVFGLKNEPIKILVFGLDAAGKTTILYRLKLGEVVRTIPTIGFNVETIAYKNLDLTVWDVGFRDKARPLIRHHFPQTKVLLCVIDSSDKERIGEIKDEIFSFINDEELLKDVLFMVLANKQDLPNAMSVQDVGKGIELDRIKQKHNIFGTVATTGEGLYEALEWLYNEYLNKSFDDSKLTEPLSDTVNDLKNMSWYSYLNSLTSKLYRAVTFK